MKLLYLVLGLVLCYALTARTDACAQPTSQGTESVEIKLFIFKPLEIEVPVGTNVVWTNEDAIEHSVSHGTPEKPGQVFDSDFFTRGEKFSYTFNEPGEYDYFCKRHPSMKGKIKVMPSSR
jgi:plastocyanin